MKKLCFVFMILLLSSCSSRKPKKAEFEYASETKVYAYSLKDKKINDIYIDYKIEDYQDVFELYTIHQNYLPLSYSSMGSSNVELIHAEVIDNIVYYEVDSFISLVQDLDIFTLLLNKTNQELGYAGAKIIYKDNIIA